MLACGPWLYPSDGDVDMLGTIVIDRIFAKEDCGVVVIEDCSRQDLTKA